MVDDNLSTPNLFDNSVPGKNGTAMNFDGNDTLYLASNGSDFRYHQSVQCLLWVMTEDLNAVLLESGRFEVIIADGFPVRASENRWRMETVGIHVGSSQPVVSPNPSLGWQQDSNLQGQRIGDYAFECDGKSDRIR